MNVKLWIKINVQCDVQTDMCVLKSSFISNTLEHILLICAITKCKTLQNIDWYFFLMSNGFCLK